jgi:hypothetical protein
VDNPAYLQAWQYLALLTIPEENRAVHDAARDLLVADYIAPPEELPAFPSATRTRAKTSYVGGLRARWKDEKGRIYEWDYRHGTVEVYSRTGRHLGEFDPDTGARTKPPNRTRRVQP